MLHLLWERLRRDAETLLGMIALVSTFFALFAAFLSLLVVALNGPGESPTRAYVVIAVFGAMILGWICRYVACAKALLWFRWNFGEYPPQDEDRRAFVQRKINHRIGGQAGVLRDLYQEQERWRAEIACAALAEAENAVLTLDGVKEAVVIEKRRFYRMVDAAASPKLPRPFLVSRNYDDWLTALQAADLRRR